MTRRKRTGTRKWDPLEIEGSYGRFQAKGKTPEVHYLQTTIAPGSSAEKRTELLKMTMPVREVLDVEELDFDAFAAVW